MNTDEHGCGSRHPTKVDAWIVLLLAGGAAVGIGGTFAAAFAATSAAELIALVVFPVLVFAAVGLLTWPIHYDIEPPVLLIRSGIIRWRVPIAGITAVHPTRNPLSSPAWSLDRLRIEYLAGDKRRAIMISPRDKSAFLDDLRAADPVLVRESDSLRRVAA